MSTMQATIDALETENAELRAVNEELATSNDDLRSTGEELHLVNEELCAAGADHEGRIAALTEMSVELERLIESARVGVVLLDKRLRVVRFTPSIRDVLPLREQDNGRPLGDFSAAFSGTGRLAAIQTVLSTGEPFATEVPGRDGTLFSMRALPHYDDAGAVAGVVLTFQEGPGSGGVASRRRAVHERRLARVLRSTRIGVWQCRQRAGEIEVDVDETAAAQLGLRAGEVARLSDLLSRVHGDDRERLRGSVAQALSAAGELEERIRLRTAAGGMHWMRLRAVTVSTGRTRRPALVGVCERVTERRGRQRQYELMVESSPVADVLVDQQGRIRLVNTRAERLLGYDRGELIGERVEVLVPERFRSSHPGRVEEFFRYGETRQRRDLLARCKDGTEVPVELAVRALDMPEGRFALAHLTDATDRVATEARLRAVDEQLTEARRELEQFAFMAGHDLKEPLRKLVGFCDLLAEEAGDGLSATARQHVGRITGASRRLARLVDGMLVFAHSGAGGLKTRCVELGSCVAGVAESLSPLLEESGAELVVGDLPSVEGDPSLLAQVLQNLLGNALRYRHPDRRPRIEVRARRRGPEWVIEVQDNGPGIAPEHHEWVFLPLQRLQGGNDGLGLGLALCRKIVARHYGRLWVESELDKGACFKFTLPVEPAAATA